MNKKIAIIPVVLIAAAAVIYFTTRNHESIYVGTIEVTKVDISPRVASIISELAVDEGYNVNTGDVLFKLSCEDIAVQREKLSADFARSKRLLNSGTLSQETFDRVKALHDDNELKWDWCVVKSPITGTVLTKYHEAGEWITPGIKVLTLGDLNDVWAYVYVAQGMLSRISLNEEVVGVLPELNNKKIAGRVIHINDEAEFTPKNVQTREERTRLVFGIKIRFDNSEGILKPGMPIEVNFRR